MERSRNGGGGKVVTFDDEVIGRHRNGSVRMYHDIGCREVVDAAGRVLQPPSRRRTYADGELDVFSAERYFKGAMDGVQRKDDDGPAVVMPPPAAPLETVVAAGARPPGAAVARLPVGTTTPRASAASVSASSATSANSKTLLLRRRRDHRDGRKCCVQVGALVRSCSGKRSVRVDSGVARGAVAGAGAPAVASKIDWYRELGMHKAALGLAGDDGGISNHGVVTAAAPLPPGLNLGTAKVAAVGRDVVREDKPAEFAPSFSSSRPRSFTLVAPPVRPANERGDDDDDDGAGSESSSDLFEIKSLMIEDCPYAPSEASIQWSVATASASETRSARWTTGGSHRGRPPAKQNRDRPAALLSGCVSHRAVEVSAAGKHAPRRRGEGLH